MSEALLVFWDVQHGHAAYIKTPNDRHIVIDFGTGSYGSNKEFSPLSYLKNCYNINQIDYIIITLPHVDHIDDIFAFDTLSPKVFSRPKHLDRTPIIQNASNNDRQAVLKYFEINDRYNLVIPDDSPDLTRNPLNWGGLVIKSYSPTNCPQNNINNHSIVMYFEFGGISAVVPGDNESISWEEIMAPDGFFTNHQKYRSSLSSAPWKGELF